MAYKESKIGLLVRLDPAAAASRLREALRKGGSAAGAAKLLGCSLRSFFRFQRVLESAGHMIREESAA